MATKIEGVNAISKMLDGVIEKIRTDGGYDFHFILTVLTRGDEDGAESVTSGSLIRSLIKSVLAEIVEGMEDKET